MARDIDDLDYNAIRTSILEVIGTGAGSYGYGQSIVSSPVFEGNIITKSQWDALRYDILNCLIHQTGTIPGIDPVQLRQVIREGAGDPVQQYAFYAASARRNRFELAPSQSTVTTVTTKTYTSSWSQTASLTFNATFASSEDARFYFNSGGKFRITSARSGGSSTNQNNAWTNVLSAAGSLSFRGSAVEEVDFYNLTNSYQVVHQRSLSTPYSANYYRIEAKSDVADNSLGTATQVDIRIVFEDLYTDAYPAIPPGDVVSGTLSVTIEEIKASGTLQPSDPADGGPTGNFSITSPAYTVSNITAT